MNEPVQMSVTRVAPLLQGFALPGLELHRLLEQVGCKLFPLDHSVPQYLAWCLRSGLIRAMDLHGAVTVSQASAHTNLNERGTEALLGVLCAVGLATRDPQARYSLSRLAREYFLPHSPFFVGDQFLSWRAPLPPGYAPGKPRLRLRLRLKFLSLLPRARFGSPARLRNQHARNLPACAAAVKTGEFDHVRCLVDLAGGSGAFSIPLALESGVERIVLVELPQALPNVRRFLAAHGLENRIELLGMDAIGGGPWRLPACDGLFVGNFLHGFDDATCERICHQAFSSLSAGGRIWIHEMIWNDNKDGPLITALWNAAIRSAGAGRQRTARELMALLSRAGFVDPYVIRTDGAFALIGACKT